MASTARLIGALLLAIALVGCALPGAAVAKCDHACWTNICKDMAHRGNSYVACMRDVDRP